MSMQIDVIDHEACPINKHGHRVITFDDRDFEDEIYIAPFITESHGEYEWLNLLKVMNDRNIKVISVMGKNHISMASIISNEMILIPQDNTELFTKSSKITTSEGDWRLYNPVYFGKTRPKDQKMEPVLSLFKFMRHRQIYVTRESMDLFNDINDLYENDLNICLYKFPRYESLVNKISDQFGSLILYDHKWRFTKKIFNDMNGNLLSFQLLACLRKNWKFICLGGLSALFTIVPCNVLVAADYVTMDLGIAYKKVSNVHYWNQDTLFLKHSVDRKKKPRRFCPTDEEQNALVGDMCEVL